MNLAENKVQGCSKSIARQVAWGLWKASSMHGNRKQCLTCAPKHSYAFNITRSKSNRNMGQGQSALNSRILLGLTAGQRTTFIQPQGKLSECMFIL